MKVSSLSANRKQVEITKEAFEKGCKSNHALYLDALGKDLYLAPAGRNAVDVRLANALEFVRAESPRRLRLQCPVA